MDRIATVTLRGHGFSEDAGIDGHNIQAEHTTDGTAPIAEFRLELGAAVVIVNDLQPLLIEHLVNVQNRRVLFAL